MNAKDLDLKIKKLDYEIEEFNSKMIFGSSKEDEKKFDKLIKEKDMLFKKKIDLISSQNSNLIQNKAIRDYLIDYTNGKYNHATSYSYFLLNEKTKKKAIEKFLYYNTNCISSKEDLVKEIPLIDEIIDIINKSPISDETLIRFQKTNITEDEERNNIHQKEYKVGEILNWGIRSTSKDLNFVEKIASGNDRIELDSISVNGGYEYTEFKIVGPKRKLDIENYSYYEQSESLVMGKFIVEKVEHFKPKIVYDETEVTFPEYLKANNYTFEERITKNGKNFITIYDNNNNRILDMSKDNFVKHSDSYDGCFSSNNNVTFEKIINGETPYKIYKKENKTKSIYGLERQIVTIQQLF